MKPAYKLLEEELKAQNEVKKHTKMKRKYQTAMGETPNVLQKVFLMVTPKKENPVAIKLEPLDKYIELVNMGKTQEAVGIAAAIESIKDHPELQGEEHKKVPKPTLKNKGLGVA